MQSLKQRELSLHAGEMLIAEGEKNTQLFTLLEGWAFRFKTLSDGRRQIISFLLPGDLVGVQQEMTDEADHGVTTLTDAVFCVFQRNALWKLYEHSPELGFNVTWLTARGQSIDDDALLSVGQQNAQERIAALLFKLFRRAADLQSDKDVAGVTFPITQQHMADALGMSLVHTNKTLRKLERLGFHRIKDGRLQILNSKALAQVADVFGDGRVRPRPLF
jgi:CRP-like cAMP-binding protein